jgi:hypothetical protein
LRGVFARNIVALHSVAAVGASCQGIRLGTPRAVESFGELRDSMRISVLVIAFSLLVGSFPVRSQQPLVGSIQGVVKDQRGAPLSYASLTTTNLDSVEPDSSRQTTGADKEGNYQFVEVPPGRYSILVQESGFQDYTVALVTVRPGETVKMAEIKMSPATSR